MSREVWSGSIGYRKLCSLGSVLPNLQNTGKNFTYRLGKTTGAKYRIKVYVLYNKQQVV